MRPAAHHRDVADAEVERSLKRGAVWALGSQVPIQIIRLFGVVILARLLSPDDYGKAAVAVTLATFSVMLGDLGYGTALVQASVATQTLASTAWWSAIAAGTGMFAAVAVFAHPVALLLGEPEVTALMVGAGSTFMLVALGSTSNAFLTRSMSFRAIQTIGVLASAASMAVAIALAAGGVGAWSLVMQQIVLAAVSSVTFVVLAGWRPTFEYSRFALKSLSRFSLPFTGHAVLYSLQTIVPPLLIGALIGVEELGIWTFSVALVVVPATLIAAPLSRVTYASFARMRDRKQRIAELWLSGTAIVAAVSLPMLFGLAAVAPDLIQVVFGTKWVPAVPIVRLLCGVAVLGSVQMWNTSVLDAAGKPHIMMWLSAVVLVVLPFAVILGSTHGLEGATACYVLAIFLFREIPSIIITTRELSIPVRVYAARLSGVLTSCVLMLFAALALTAILEKMGVRIGLRLVLSISGGAIVYVSLLSVFARQVVVEIVRIARRQRALA